MLPIEKESILRAMGSGDPAIAEEAFREIDGQLKSSGSGPERANLLMRKAVLYGILGRVDDARRQLVVALQEAPDDSFTRLQFDYLDGSLYHQAEKVAVAFTRLTAVLENYAELLAQPDLRFIHNDIQQHRAFELFRLRRFQDAIPVFEECLSSQMKPEDRSVALASLGICHSKLKNREAARDYLLEARDAGLASDWAGQAFSSGSHVRSFEAASRIQAGISTL
jgi:tetratricopeptide (TPR) repeat protein